MDLCTQSGMVLTMITEQGSPQAAAVPMTLHPVHLPVRRVDRDEEWTSLDAPEGVDLGNLLYRFYDGDGLPLYFGKTTTQAARLEQHRKRAEWYGLARYVALSLYPSHGRLLRAERAAIRHEQPRFNVTDRRGKRRVLLDLDGPVAEAAYEVLDEATPEFIAELARLLGDRGRSLLAASPPGPDWDELTPAPR